MMNDLFVKSIRLKDDIAKDDYLSDILSVKYLKQMGELNFNKKVTFIIGENGTGKSTLLEALAVRCRFNPEGGTRNFSFSTANTHSDLFNHMIVSRQMTPRDGFFFRAESFYNVASEIDRLDKIMPLKDYYGGKSLHEQSHGESFLSLIINRFGGNGLYILDEPEAALSPNKQLILLARINQLVKKNSQFIIATHSPILMAYPNADIYVIDENGINLTEYSNTDHYTITKYFLNNTEKMLQHLFKEDN